jgi:hypothetical protein
MECKQLERRPLILPRRYYTIIIFEPWGEGFWLLWLVSDPVSQGEWERPLILGQICKATNLEGAAVGVERRQGNLNAYKGTLRHIRATIVTVQKQ